MLKRKFLNKCLVSLLGRKLSDYPRRVTFTPKSSWTILHGSNLAESPSSHGGQIRLMKPSLDTIVSNRRSLCVLCLGVNDIVSNLKQVNKVIYDYVTIAILPLS